MALSKDDCSKGIDINRNNVKSITLADDWDSLKSSKLHKITIDFNGYIEIELVRRVNYNLVPDYINELKIFMQLYYPNKFCVDKIWVKIDDTFYQIVTPQMDVEYKEAYVERTIKEIYWSFLRNVMN